MTIAVVPCQCDLLIKQSACVLRHTQTQYPELRQSVSQQGEAITFSVLRALCDTAPRNQMRPLGLLLHSLLAQYGAPAAAWLAGSLQSPDLQGAACTPPWCGRTSDILRRCKPQVY